MADALSRPPTSVKEGAIIDTDEHPLDLLHCDDMVDSLFTADDVPGTALEWPNLLKHLLESNSLPPCSPKMVSFLQAQRSRFLVQNGMLFRCTSRFGPLPYVPFEQRASIL
jgi:hypothetical protein